jgi:hypothetical protein
MTPSVLSASASAPKGRRGAGPTWSRCGVVRTAKLAGSELTVTSHEIDLNKIRTSIDR